MSEFGKIAERIAGHTIEASTRGGIRANEIGGIIDDIVGPGRFNCYPGQLGAPCRPFAAFISLTSKKRKANRRKHLDCRQAIELLIQHMGSCGHITDAAVLIIDSLDADAVSDWLSNLQRIESEKHLETYLIIGGTYHRINFN